MGQSAAEQEALRRALGELMRRMGEAGMEIPRALGQAEMQMRGARGSLEEGQPGPAADAQSQAVDAMQRAGQAMMEQLQEQMAQQQGEGPGGQPQPTGRRGRDPLGRAMRNEGGMDTRGVEVPDESDLGRARDVLEELYRRSGDRAAAAARARLLPPPARPVLAGRLLSPNRDLRPPGAAVDMLVLHYTGMQSAAAALARLRDPAAKVSAHYLVDEDGSWSQLVPEAERAWHAGRELVAGARPTSTTSRSASSSSTPATNGATGRSRSRRWRRWWNCAASIVRRWAIPAGRIVGHSDIAPDRKQDPGELFDWPRLAAAGLGLWPGTAVAGAARAGRRGGAAGRHRLPAERACRSPVVLAAFQRRYRRDAGRRPRSMPRPWACCARTARLCAPARATT